jgi:hypothetical protein
MKLAPVANEAHFIGAQLQSRRIVSELSCNRWHSSIWSDIGARRISRWQRYLSRESIRRSAAGGCISCINPRRPSA